MHASKRCARQRVLGITAETEIGKIYLGMVERIVDFGTFLNILPGKDALLRISTLSDQSVEKVTDMLKAGQKVEVLALDVDKHNRIKLLIKDVAAAEDLCYLRGANYHKYAPTLVGPLFWPGQ